MSIQPPQGILNIPNATLRVGKLAVDSTAGFDTVFNNVERNTILLVDSTEYTDTKQWDLKMPNIFVTTFEIKGDGSSFNFRNTSNGDATTGYTLTFSGTTLTLKYNNASLTTATIPDLDSTYGKVYLTYEKQHFTVTVDGTLVLNYKDTGTRTFPDGEYVNFFAGTGSLGFKNLKVVAGHFISDGTSNIAYVGGGEVAVGKALAFNRVSNVSQIKVDSNVVTEYTGPHDRPLREYPEIAMTTASETSLGYKGYKVSTSSQLSGYEGYKAFDKTGWETPAAENNNAWVSGGSKYVAGTGLPDTGAFTTSYVGGTATGEYIQLQLPRKIKISKYDYTPRTHTGNDEGKGAPKTVKLLGSNDDGSTWTLIKDITHMGTRPEEGVFYTARVDATEYYDYIRFVATSTYTDGTSPTFTDVRLSQIRFYGHEEGSGSLDTTLKSVYNVPATTGTQLEVYYDAKDLTTMPGTVTDLAGGDQNGAVTGHSPTLDETNGIESFKFDGVDDYITTTLTNPNTDWVHSVSMWVYPIDVSDDSVNGYIFAIGPEVSNQVSALRFKPDGFNYTRWTGGGSKTFNGPVTSGRWHHVTLISPGSTDVQVYLDGRLLTHTSDSLATLTLPQNTSLSVGRFAASASYSRPFTGSIANFRLYSKALNADQVKELYDYQKDYFLGSKSQVTLYKGHLGVGVTEPSGQLELAGDERIQEYPPRGMTHSDGTAVGSQTAGQSKNITYIEGHGEFKASASEWSVNTIGYDGHQPYNAFEDTPNRRWLIYENVGYNATTGAYEDNEYQLSASSGTPYGHWLKLEMPYPVNIRNYYMKANNTSHGAKDWQVWASNDDINWTHIHSYTNETSANSFAGSYYNVSHTGHYKMFAIIVTRIFNASTEDRIDIFRVKYFGTPGPTTLDKGSLTLGRSLDVPRVSRYDVDTETPRPEKLVVDFDTTVNSSPTDISGKGNHGTFGGSAYYSSADKAFDFDGTSGCNISGKHNLSGSNPVHTISGWIKKTSTNTGWEYLFTIGTSATGQMSGFTMNGGNLYFTIFGDGVAFNTPDNFNNNWQHIVGVYTGGTTLTPSNFIVYVNGVKVQTIAGLGNTFTLTGNQVTLGANTGNGERFIGQISNFKLYSVALEPSEVKKLYNLGRTGRSMVISDTAVGIGKVPEAQLDVRGTVNVDGDIFLNGFKIFQPITPIARDGLAVLLDASDPNSYPATGTIFYDTSGNGRHGTAQGSVGWTSSGQQSYFDFPGTDADKLNQTSGSALLYKDICIVFKVDALSSSFAYLVSNGGDTSLRVYDGNILSPGNDGDWSNGGTGTTYYVNGVATTADVPITNGQWYILGGESKCYSSAFNYTLGYGYPGRALDGKIAFVALYNRVLSADEQLQNYAALKKRFGV
jgi:hypothetical protein